MLILKERAGRKEQEQAHILDEAVLAMRTSREKAFAYGKEVEHFFDVKFATYQDTWKQSKNVISTTWRELKNEDADHVLKYISDILFYDDKIGKLFKKQISEAYALTVSFYRLIDFRYSDSRELILKLGGNETLHPRGLKELPQLHNYLDALNELGGFAPGGPYQDQRINARIVALKDWYIPEFLGYVKNEAHWLEITNQFVSEKRGI